MIRIQTARKIDYLPMQRFLEDAYGRLAFNYMPLYYPWCWQENNVDYEHIYLIRENTEIVSMVRVFPLELVQGGARIRVGGVGNVGTTPARVGQGYMRQLLHHAIAQMREEQIPISILWGDQHRYQPFGYETAGKTLTLTITSRGLERTRIEAVSPTRFLGQDHLLSLMIQAYRAHPFHRIRTAEETRLAYQHVELLLFCAGEEGQQGYLGLFNHSGAYTVAEFGGNAATILRITAYLMRRLGINSLEFAFPGWNWIPPVMRMAASNWKIVPTCMVKILDLEAAIQYLRPSSPEPLSLAVSQLEALPEVERVEALFGTATHSPFNIFVWPLDNI